MKKLIIGYITFFLFTSCAHLTHKYTDLQTQMQRKECLEIYDDIIISIEELVFDSILLIDNFKKIEKTLIDSSSIIILDVEYDCEYVDNSGTIIFYTGSLLTFENNVDAAKLTLNLFRTGFNSAIRNGDNLNDATENNLDSLVSFGDESTFLEYRKNGNLLAYSIIGRDKNIVFLNCVVANKIKGNEYINLLKEKINILTNFAQKY